MVCSNCGSDQLQRLSLVFESGLSHINTTTTGIGVGVGMGGVGVGVGKGGTRGTQVSATALRAAPPRQRTTSAALWMIIFGLIAFACFGGKAWTAGVIFGALAFWAFKVNQNVVTWNRTVYPGLWKTWDASYLCLRCGSMAPPVAAFVTTAAQPINVTPQPELAMTPDAIVPPTPAEGLPQ